MRYLRTRGAPAIYTNSPLVLSKSNDYTHYREEVPDGTFDDEFDNSFYDGAGTFPISGGSQRRRYGASYAIPTGLPPILTATLNISGFLSGSALGTCNYYISSTDDSATPNGWQNHLDHLISSPSDVFPSGWTGGVSVLPAYLSGKGGLHVSFVVGLQHEIDNTWIGLAYTFAGSSFDLMTTLTLTFV